MLTDNAAQPLPGRTYHGFSGPQPGPASPPRKRFPYALVAGGIGAAVAMGLVFGLWTRPQLGPAERPAAPMRPAAVEDPQRINVEVAAPAPVPLAAPQAVGRLDVLSPGMAQAPRAAAVPQALPPPPPAGPLAQPAAAPRPQPVAGPGFNCADTRGLAEEMVCEDPGLAQAERRMALAYRRALAAGASRDQLRGEQQDWLAIREDAAHQSPNALAQVYRQRINELEAAAQDAPR